MKRTTPLKPGKPPSRKSGLKRTAGLSQVSSLKSSTGGKGKRSKGQREAAREWREAVVQGPCVMCVAFAVPPFGHRQTYEADFRRLDAHHLIPKGTLIREGHGAHVNDPRNGASVCRYHHSRHHAHVERIPRRLLPAAVFEFAAELRLEAILDREYPVTDERHEAKRLKLALLLSIPAGEERRNPW